MAPLAAACMLIAQPNPFFSGLNSIRSRMLGLLGAVLVLWLCWPGIKWLIGTVEWLASWYACVSECLPFLH
jgi:hypothetical protein